MNDWIQIAIRRDVLWRSLKVGLLVGTILTAINYGDVIANGEIVPAMWWKIPLTYCVPFSVSTYATVSAVKHGRADEREIV